MLVDKLEELFEAATFPDPRLRIDAQETLRELRVDEEEREKSRRYCSECRRLKEDLEEERVETRHLRSDNSRLKAKVDDLEDQLEDLREKLDRKQEQLVDLREQGDRARERAR
jgi:septation ring formation regulator EzrA